jgi:phosphoserine phosphatase RsbU/P
LPVTESRWRAPLQFFSWERCRGALLTSFLVLLIVGLDAVQQGDPELVSLLVAAPLLTAAMCDTFHTVGVGLFTTVVAAVYGVIGDVATTGLQLVRLTAILLATLVAGLIARVRERRALSLDQVRRVAEAAQQALLPPVAPRIGSVMLAVRYVSATADATIGGDLYEALDTPYGVRALIGDVRGKGLEAVRLAATVLGAFRYVAYERADLRNVVADLDRVVGRAIGEEDFVTAVLLEVRGGQLTVLNCGHPAPLLLRDGSIKSLEPPSPVPPLGLVPTPAPRTERLEPGDRLLLYTDGLGEARRDGEFFPVEDRAGRLLGRGTVDHGLYLLDQALREWVGGEFADDIALMAAEYLGGADAEPHLGGFHLPGRAQRLRPR